MKSKKIIGEMKMKPKEILGDFLYDTAKLSDRISDLRRPNGITAYTLLELSKQIEEKTNVYISATQLGKYEDNDLKQKMNINNILAIADFYEVSIDYLLGRSDSKSSNITDKHISQKLGLSDESINMLSMINRRDYKFPQSEFTRKIINFMLKDFAFLTQLTALLMNYFKAYEYYEFHKVNNESKFPSEINDLDIARYSVMRLFENFIDSSYKNIYPKIKQRPLFTTDKKKKS